LKKNRTKNFSFYKIEFFAKLFFFKSVGACLLRICTAGNAWNVRVNVLVWDMLCRKSSV